MIGFVIYLTVIGNERKKERMGKDERNYIDVDEKWEETESHKKESEKWNSFIKVWFN